MVYSTSLDLFETEVPSPLAEGVMLMRGRARAEVARLLAAIDAVSVLAPPRIMSTPGGHRMSVAMTNCGDCGWVSDPSGYRYAEFDPLSGRPWPAMPDVLRTVAASAAESAGFSGFDPDVCLINRYVPGTRMGLHSDRDERDYSHPIVSVSLGLPAVFQLGGLRRSDPVSRIRLEHGDILVWGGPARLRYHGVLTLRAGDHPMTGQCRINLTFRRAR